MLNKIKIHTVFLDMDGVVADFHQGVYNAFNQPYDYAALPRVYDFWTAWDKVVTRREVNAACNTDFWANLPWTHDGHEILDAVWHKFDVNQIYLLTVPMPNVLSPTGKWMWIAGNIPELYNRTLIGQIPKSLLARPDTLLIDDHDKCVEGFKAAGGEAIRVPRPWNCMHPYSAISLEIVKLALRNYQTQ